MRVGFGYDIHPLTKGRKLYLCGIEIPHPAGLAGHSDADVALHAVADAILGALGKGDIGEYFPNTDPACKDMPSSMIVKKAAALVSEERSVVGNVDITIVAEEPMIQPFKARMRRSVAALLGIDERRVSVKATTNEKIGPIGAHEAIASFACALIEEKR